ncbi:MAG: hypothetical protein NWR51_12760 [Akkermansiaceae bacterium]|nr:hypothetical protein [Akkermansiaceae bacterium]
MDDKFSRQRDLASVTNDEPRTVFEEDVHLALTQMTDFDFDKAGFGDRPWLG